MYLVSVLYSFLFFIYTANVSAVNATLLSSRFFFRAAAMQPRSCDEHLFVRPSVYPSVKRVNCDKMKETSVHILITYERSIHLVFRHEEWLVGDVPLYLKFWAKLIHPFKNGDFQSIFPCSASAVTPSEKSSVITNRNFIKSFPMSLR